MPVPTTWADINTNPALNSPQGSEPLGTQADDYIRQAFAFIKQLHDGWEAADGSVIWTGNHNANGKSLINLANPINPQDAATKAYTDLSLASNFPRGSVMMWAGALANKPAGWLLCDGTNGTPDCRDRFVTGAGATYGPVQYGGANSKVIPVDAMPVHTHSVYDPGHAHSIYDPGHGHGLNDPGHDHTPSNGQQFWSTGNSLLAQGSGGATSAGVPRTSKVGTGISVYASATGIGINGAGTGITLYNTGGGGTFDVRPAFVSLYYLMKA